MTDGLPIKEQTENIHKSLVGHHIETYIQAIHDQREYILKAFIAETGMKPSECEQVTKQEEGGSIIWFIRKKVA